MQNNLKVDVGKLFPRNMLADRYINSYFYPNDNFTSVTLTLRLSLESVLSIFPLKL